MEFEVLTLPAELELSIPVRYAELIDIPASAIYMIESEGWILV